MTFISEKEAFFHIDLLNLILKDLLGSSLGLFIFLFKVSGSELMLIMLATSTTLSKIVSVMTTSCALERSVNASAAVSNCTTVTVSVSSTNCENGNLILKYNYCDCLL